MGISLFISPIAFPFTVMSWTEIPISNYFRGVILLIGSAFLPGTSILNILFPGKILSKKLNLESFLIKLTLSPLLSFLMIGTIVLILDSFGIVFKEIYMIILFLLIVSLVLLDFAFQRLRNHNNFKNEFFKRKIALYNISKSTFIIIIIAIGVSVLSFGIYSTVHYLITGDSWTALNPTLFIGDPNDSPVNYGKISRYPIYWCYISYGLSVLNGLPFINTNAMMAPFSYLYVTSIYLLCKSILRNFKSRYAVLSTIIISIFSDLLFISPNFSNNAIVESTVGSISILIFSGQFFFYYKSFALYLAFSSIALFISANTETDRDKSNKSTKKLNIKLIIIASLFLTGAYMTYMLPLIPTLAFIIIFFIFSKRREKQNHYLLLFLTIFLIFFFLFDLLTNFFNSFLFSNKFNDLIVWLTSAELNNSFILNYFAYFFFSLIFLTYFSIYFFNQIRKRFYYPKNLNKNKINQRDLNYKNQLKNAFTSQKTQKFLILVFLTVFTLLLFLEIFNFYFKFYIFKFIFIDGIYWLYSISILLDIIFLSLGLFGIGGIYLSYICLQKNRRIFTILSTWLFFSLFYASLVHLAQIYNGVISLTSPQNIEVVFIKYMIFWFTRNWYYAIIPLSIFFAIGMIDLRRIIKKININKINSVKKISQRSKTVIKFSALSSIIIFSYTNIIIASIQWGRLYGEGTVTDAEAQVIGFIPLYIPDNSVILTEHKYSLFHGIRTMSSSSYKSIRYTFDPSKNYKSYIETLNNLNIKYAILYESGHYGVHPMIQSFINNFLMKYYFSNTLYQFHGLKIQEYLLIDTEPYYQASQDFIIYNSGADLGFWGYGWDTLSTGSSNVQIIDEKEDHIKVLELTPSAGFAAIRKEETGVYRGTVEFWLYTSDTSQKFSYQIYGYQNIMLEFLINDNKWQYINKTGSATNIPNLNSIPQNNTWHHIRIDFEGTNQKYVGLNQFKWRTTIDGSETSDSIDFIDYFGGDWYYHSYKSDISNNYSIYIDAIGFSWDDYYTIGNNMNKTVFHL